MTSSRIVRGTKGRIFLYICAVLFITGLIACYNNVRMQLDEVHKSFALCKQEQDNLSTQIQVIYDYKQRLEKSLKTEKADHERTKIEFEARINEEKLKNDKINGDSKLRFSTLQQHYSLLQTQHDDFKEECSKIQRQQLDEINKLQAKLKEVQEELKTALNDKENTVQHFKTLNQALKDEQDKIKKKLELNQNIYEPTKTDVKRLEYSTTHFSKMIADGESHYVIPELNKSKNLGQPNLNEESIQNVLANPSNVFANSKSSTPNSLKVSVSKGDLNGPIPLKLPSVTPETLKRSTSKEPKMNDNVLHIPFANKKLPEGVVPVPQEIIDDKGEENQLDANLSNKLSNRDQLKQSFHNIDNDVANEVFDEAQNNIKKPDDLAQDADYDGRHFEEGDDDLDDVNPAEKAKGDEIVRQ